MLDWWRAAIDQRLRTAGVADEAAAELTDTLVEAVAGGFLLARVQRSPDALHHAGRAMRRLVGAEFS